MKKINSKHIISQYYYFLPALIAFLFPTYKLIISYIIALWTFFIIFQKDKKKLFKTTLDYNKILFILQISLFFIIVLSYFFSNNKENAFKIIQMRLSLLFFPFLFILSRNKIEKQQHLILKSFVLGNILATLICIFFAFYHSIHFADRHLIFNPIDPHGYRYFDYMLFSVFIHPAYFSMYLNFSIVIILYTLDNSQKTNIKKTILYYIIVLLFAISIYFLSSRAGLITLIFIFIWRIIIIFRNKSNLIFKIAILIFFLIFITYMPNNQRFIKMINQIEETIKLGKKSDNYPDRLILWENSIDIIKQNFWLGTTPGDAQTVLNKNLKKYEKYLLKENTGFNSHNQYLQTLVESGIIGFILLFLIFAGGLFVSVKRKQTIFTAFLLIVMFNFLFESMLNTFSGIVFIFFFLNFFLFVYKSDDNSL